MRRGPPRSRRSQPNAGTAARGRAGAGGRRARRRSAPSLRWPARRQSFAICARLWTASAIGTAAGSASRAAAVRTGRCGITSTASSSAGDLDPVHIRAVADHEAADAAQRRRCRYGPRSRWQGPARRRRGAGEVFAASSPATTPAALEPKPPLSGIAELTRNSKRSAGSRCSKARTIRLLRSRRRCRSVSSSELPRLLHLNGQEQVKRCRENVEARAQVRARPGHSNSDPAHRRIARSIAPSSGSHGITPPTSDSAVSGSFSP